MTFKEQTEKLRSLKRRLAIWEAIHHLTDAKFISKDSNTVSGIKEPGTGTIVSEDEIEDVLKTIADGPIAEITAEIDAIENQEVVILGESKAKA